MSFNYNLKNFNYNDHIYNFYLPAIEPNMWWRRMLEASFAS